MAIYFVQISIELFETLKVLASQPGYVFQSEWTVTGPLWAAATVEEC